MRTALDALPTDTETLQQLVRDMRAAVELREQVISESRIEIDRLQAIIRAFQRARFGRSAERLDPEQQSLALEELEGDIARVAEKQEAVLAEAIAAAPIELPPRPQPPKPTHRAPLPAHLPRVETVLPAPCERCPDCGGALHDAGATSSEMLDWIPAQLRVARITRSKRACRACGTLHQASAPERVIAGGLATPALLASITRLGADADNRSYPSPIGMLGDRQRTPTNRARALAPHLSTSQQHIWIAAPGCHHRTDTFFQGRPADHRRSRHRLRPSPYQARHR